LLLPMLFGELMATSLVKLHLSPEAALLLMMAIILGGLVNIPVKRIAHERVVPLHPLAVFGLGGRWPATRRAPASTPSLSQSASPLLSPAPSCCLRRPAIGRSS